jgi:hypothetical protein
MNKFYCNACYNTGDLGDDEYPDYDPPTGPLSRPHGGGK